MTVSELKALLADVPDDTLVVLSRDEEGNGYAPAYGHDVATYFPRGHNREYEVSHPDDDPEEYPLDGGVPAFVLWPGW